MKKDESGMKKRMGIFVMYDRNGQMDRYIDFLLSSMQNLFHKLVIVVNGYIQEEELSRLKKYTQCLFVRENKEFDAGAYKDVFFKYIPRDEWVRYDEITMFNDTFYGPIYPLVDIWNKFKQIEVDFWGITRHPETIYSSGKKVPSHVQGYFLTIRKKMLQSQEFLAFWESMPKLKDVIDAIWEFEIRFTTYFEGHGFVGKALMDICDYPMDIKNQNPYIFYNLRLIRNKKIPFLKKKALLFQVGGFEETIDAIEYIEKEKLYDTDMIWDNILRLSRENQFSSIFNYSKLEDFYHRHNRIFIYGIEKYGQRIKKYFEYRNWSYECFLVSREIDAVDGCLKYDSNMILPTDGIIMALNTKNLEEVLRKIMESVSEEQLFLPEIISNI